MTDDYVPDQPTPTSTPNPCPGLYTVETVDGVNEYTCHTATSTPPPPPAHPETGAENMSLGVGLALVAVVLIALGRDLIRKGRRS